MEQVFWLKWVCQSELVEDLYDLLMARQVHRGKMQFRRRRPYILAPAMPCMRARGFASAIQRGRKY